MENIDQIPSPCIGVCQINSKTKFCLGCWRSLREVAHWSRYSGTEKLGKNLEISFNDFSMLKSVVMENKIDMVVVGPEEP